MTTIVLEFHEVKRIHDYLNISSKKNDITFSKIKSVLDSMKNSECPICKIVVENKKEASP